jgi:hypothetical protein
MHLLSGEADVGDGRMDVLLWNIHLATSHLSSMLLNFTPFLRGVVLVS